MVKSASKARIDMITDHKQIINQIIAGIISAEWELLSTGKRIYFIKRRL